MPEIGIIIPVRNRWISCTQPILTQLAQQGVLDSKNYLVVVVDDGSTDGTVAGIQTLFPTIVLLKGDGNLWWGGAIALGMEYLYNRNIPILVWMNDDMILSENFIEKLNEASQQALEQQAIVGGVVTYREDPSWIVFSGMIQGRIIRSFDQFSDLYTPMDSLHGNIVIFPKLIIDKLGLPCLKDFPHYGGDHAYTELARKQGIPIFIDSDLVATTDYTATDVIRYMPILLQWYFAKTFAEKLNVLKSLRQLKSNQNIWHIVNRMRRGKPKTYWWHYELFYIKKVLQCVLGSFVSQQKICLKVEYFCNQQNIAPILRTAIYEKLSAFPKSES